MKSRKPLLQELVALRLAYLLGPCLAAASVFGADTNAPPAAAPQPLTPEQMYEGGSDSYKNWLQLSGGGFMSSGNIRQFQQQHQTSNGAFGGIEGLHYEGQVATNTTLTIDGRSIFDNHDYDLRLGLTKDNVGYVRFSFNEFRDWYNGDGGFYPPNGAYYPSLDDALGLDRGIFSFEAGLRMDKLPKITFKYTRTFREGSSDSTSWGDTHPTSTSLVRGIAPSFWDISDHSDAFLLDLSPHIKATEFGLGVRYEFGSLNDSLNISQFPNEPVQQKITDSQDTTYDLFNTHGYTETWIKKNLMLSTGVSFSDLDNNFTGSRIYGSDFDVNYVPSAQSGFGYYGLGGGSHLQEYVADVNLFYKPTPFIAIVPSLRVLKEDWDADTTGLGTLGDNLATPFNVNSQRGDLEVRERLDLRYTGLTNWVLFARGEWTDGTGNLYESGGLTQVNGFGPPPIQLQTDDSRFFQKYSAGARWYLSRGVIMDAGGYYKLDDFTYNNFVDSTPNNSANVYPGYLVLQDFDTYDGNFRLTLRPLPNVTLISRYEYQLSTIHTKPDPISGLGEVQSSDMTSHILAEDISWAPVSRLFLQAGFNYVISETKTPASDITQAILNAQNNYWTLNFSSGFVVDDKTDLNLAYLYYRADDYQNNADVGLPLGSGAEENGVTATLTRRINKHLRLTLRYGFYDYTDQLFGDNRNFTTHLVYTSLQYRF